MGVERSDFWGNWCIDRPSTLSISFLTKIGAGGTDWHPNSSLERQPNLAWGRLSLVAKFGQVLRNAEVVWRVRPDSGGVVQFCCEFVRFRAQLRYVAQLAIRNVGRAQSHNAG